MNTDPIIDEIHRIRAEHAKSFNYNLIEIFNDLKDQEKNSGKEFISLPIRREIKIKKEIVREEPITIVS